MTTPQDPPPGDRAQRGPGEELGDEDPESVPGLAQERTSLAWTRTAIAFAALGGVVLKANVVTGLIILAVAPVIWQLGRVTRGASAAGSGDGLPAVPMVGATRLFIIAVTIAAVALLCLIVAIFGKSVPGAIR
jgi:uncharacterized membrane protein YidH (DUF202 family)